MPEIVNTNLSAFKNFLFNQVKWSEIKTNAQFNPRREMVNAAFGRATMARSARIMQGAIRFSF